jgi:alkylation response protein AidB-like acyl-CoA dehydrogenase
MDQRAAAARIAEEVLFADALAVDGADRVPAAHFDRLAEAGLYGVALSEDSDLAGDLVETLASGCLATTFVWLQHLGPTRAAPPLWRDRLASGESRSGIALAGVRGDPPGLRVSAVDGGYLLDGQVPWVTGWDLVDVVHVAARDADDLVHFLLVDARSGPTLRADLLPLVAVQASRTVHLTFDGHFVPADRLTGTRPYAEWIAADSDGSALNGYLALGVARRCLDLLGADPGALDEVRTALRGAAGADVAPARAAASALAWGTATTLMVQTGSRSVLRDNHAQRLYREAGFLLVFGSRPRMRTALLAALSPPPSPADQGEVRML